ncbi:Jlp2p KNAG_0E02170 [Huiozyma naganishii CBS 8797]|uniref:NFACT RNA-binding domain-containing protein n=1 Tax=Huiozyma naganishii (strain ATCC MYA-139 / BCRC 22969 / CBS 8797 / KCTC 17520 / NBRC 10181 / NCYC 3082 / Yp74L-3) TaxID=1071383 RepID=J7RLS9_HUIN7|nr:hypothetical protein KNAG_0E02170 [Kazachstania naganishii CBS 8797]CCK70478.1 hypothetical protein KNAG_0E02170 [Kazachstania naganishii CBS 8797]
MVYFYESQPDADLPGYQIIAGRDKFENDLLIKYFYRELNHIWFHVDKYSSGHVYLKLQNDKQTLGDVPRAVVSDCLQLCKSESIQGNKLDQCTIVITPWTNLRKSGYMKPGEVSFKATSRCKKMVCHARDNKVLNRLAKTRVALDDGVETLLHEAKKSKDGRFFTEYLSAHRERLLLEEREKKQAKKLKKRLQKQETDPTDNEPTVSL